MTILGDSPCSACRLPWSGEPHVFCMNSSHWRNYVETIRSALTRAERERDEARAEVGRLRGAFAAEHPEAIMEMCNDVVTLDARELAAMHDREISTSAEQRGFERGVREAAKVCERSGESTEPRDRFIDVNSAKMCAANVLALLPVPSPKPKEGGT